jgi:hypothetical protein
VFLREAVYLDRAKRAEFILDVRHAAASVMTEDYPLKEAIDALTKR